MDYKRISLFAGHYGSGKTNVAVNYALRLKKIFGNVTVADIDIVNPYFRTKDGEKMLKENGIRLISSQYANTNVDLPALPPEIYSITQNRDGAAVIDVGGDDRGALALGRYSKQIADENNYDMFFVINMYRPETRDAKSTYEIMREIEQSGGLKFTGIINNSNLGEETCADDVLKSVGYAKEVSELTGLPLCITTVEERVFPYLDGKIDNLMPINIYISWKDRI